MTNSLYRVDYDFFVNSLLPITKRSDINTEWLKSLTYPNDWVNRNFYEYINGVTYSTWTASFTYSVGDRVIGGINYLNGVYESKTASNYGNTVSNTTYWTKINDNFIGKSESTLNTSNKLKFEWGLNRYFGTTFREPNGVTGSTYSDIYITDNNTLINSLFVGVNPPLDYEQDYIYTNRSTGYVTVTTTIYPSYQYTINVPSSVFSSIPGTESNIRNFADKYNTAPLKYRVQTY